ncbi:copper homeostasis protein CutC [Streptomyces gobiensis]|uniref:copper homeostasis protein CutC n=1 Tax=Streptomyces gobiensis TaxID=2875706 RepID=UPI001E358E74|nr:copper homeostasis protein CutC [Streptomyces gobiensis]UGY92093.1 copper homeostasis protein CutC [Streptomyces gobiensis]
MSRPILEVIALTAEDAIAARAGGADRLELVTDMAAEGLTPARETFAAVRAAVDIPIRVMLRPAGGFSAGDARTLDALRAQAQLLRAEGADEFVLGFLDEAGQPDLTAIGALLDVIYGCRWTFHRAIDRASDRGGLRKALAELPGLDTYLTAGASSGVDAGLAVLRTEAARSAAGEPGYGARILVGGGLRLEHTAQLRTARIDAFHIGGAARPHGWDAPVDANAVRVWRTALSC